MSLSLTTNDLAQLELANRALLSPLAAPTPDAWLHEAGTVVRDLVRGDAVITLAPTPAGLFLSDDAPEVTSEVTTYVEAVTTEGMRFRDPVVDAWHGMRRQASLEAFCWDINAQMVEAHGLRMRDSAIVSDALGGHAYHDFVGLLRTTTEGDAMIWVLHREHGAFRFGQETTAVLRALVPAFRSGLDILSRLHAHRQALDALNDPLIVFGTEAHECHRTPAWSQMLTADPERDQIEAALRALVNQLDALAFPRGGRPRAAPQGPIEREVQTATGHYILRGSLLPPGVFTADGGVMVSAAVTTQPSLPAPDELREQFGLTRREAEVALLLAEGLSNNELADWLFISPHTVRRHTEQVLGKLGLNSRKALSLKLMQP